MELRQLATFQAVAASLSFTRAALALNYAQSSVTAQIQALEDELGVRLFDRLGRRIVLTEAGRRLQVYAGRILALADEARVAVAGDAEPSGTLTIAASETLTTYRLPPMLRTFRERYPGVRLLLRVARPGEVVRAVGDGTLDAALVLDGRDEPYPSCITAEPLHSEPLVVVAGPQHPLASAEHVSPADLDGEPMLMSEAGCSYRTQFEQALALAGAHPASTLEFGSVEAIKQCVIAGMGIAVLPRMAVRAGLARGELAALRWCEPGFRVTTRLLWHKGKWHTPALAAFLATARKLLAADTDTDDDADGVGVGVSSALLDQALGSELQQRV
jgi:DNA-binding transcriptional LysR family regulator